MLICKVVGHVWATKKEEGLEGLKLMVVQEIDGTGRKKGNTFVAADVVGAGIGEQVLTVAAVRHERLLEEIQCRWMLRLWPLSILLK